MNIAQIVQMSAPLTCFNVKSPETHQLSCNSPPTACDCLHRNSEYTQKVFCELTQKNQKHIQTFSHSPVTNNPLFTSNHFQSYKSTLLPSSLSYKRAATKINTNTDTSSPHFLSKCTKIICILHQVKVCYPI